MSGLVEESGLRHPWERTVFVGSVVLNVALMVGAFLLLRTSHDWLQQHPLAGKSVVYLQSLAIALAFAALSPAVLSFLESCRRGSA